MRQDMIIIRRLARKLDLVCPVAQSIDIHNHAKVPEDGDDCTCCYLNVSKVTEPIHQLHQLDNRMWNDALNLYYRCSTPPIFCRAQFNPEEQAYG